jgi:hypothetical protein
MCIEIYREFDRQFRKTYDNLEIKHLGECDFKGENSGAKPPGGVSPAIP